MRSSLPSVTKWLALLLCLPAFVQPSFGGPEAVREDNIVGTIDPVAEKRFGELRLEELLRQYSRSANTAQTDLVNDIGRRILNAIDDSANTDDWQFMVLDAPGTVNAYSLAGGKIVIFSGLLKLMTVDGKIDADMLASVLGHEIAHARMHHTIAGVRDTQSLNWVLENLPRLQKEGEQGWSDEQRRRMQEMARARFTREQEFEADQLGALYAALAGYSYRGGMRWAQAVIKGEGDFGMNEYLPESRAGGEVRAADHPSWSERIAKMEAFQGRLLNVAGEFTWGNEMLRVGNLDKAIQCFKDVSAVFPSCFEAWNNLGKAYHLRYLQNRKLTEVKFQTQLVDYVRDLREMVRGGNDLHNALSAYRRARQLSPGQPGVRLNLATALLHDSMASAANREDDLAEAALLLDGMLARQPDNPQVLNAKAILVYCKKAEAEPGKTAALAETEKLFQRAAAQDYLPARFNLAVVLLESGREPEALTAMREYLGRDATSPWATLARVTLKERQGENPPEGKPAGVAAVGPVLSVRLGATRAELLQILNAPERIVRCSTSEDSSGEIYWYDSLGAAYLLSEGRVELINLQAQPQRAGGAFGAAPPPPELAGVFIGATVEEMEKSFGRAAQVSAVPDSAEKVYSYLAGDARVDFRVNFSKVYRITVSKRA